MVLSWKMLNHRPNKSLSPVDNVRNLQSQEKNTKASITHLANRFKNLETNVHEPSTLDLAEQIAQKLKSLNSEFKVQHFAIIDLINEEDQDSLSKEQEILDNHDEEIVGISLRIENL